MKKKINFKQPKYIFPLIILPFLLLFFYLYNDTFAQDENIVLTNEEGIQTGINASQNVQNQELEDKMRAFENRYRHADGYTAITSFDNDDTEDIATFDDLYSASEKRRLDSIDNAINQQIKSSERNINSRSGYVPTSSSDNSPERELMNLLTANQNNNQSLPKEEKQVDPLQMMREQYRLLDSFEKANDPSRQEELMRQEQQKRAEEEVEKFNLRKLTVQRANKPKSGFNTITQKKDNAFIKAIIDENISGYAGSRLRIRLLEDIKIGENLIKKGTYLYALITGFSEQRVKLNIVSIMHHNNVLPINLSIYDMDGMEGLYVPSSAFREFTKELGATSMQGFNMNTSASNQQELLMSTLQKAFQSTSSAVANAIRKNKAKFKYNTFVYLIDKQELQN